MKRMRVSYRRGPQLRKNDNASGWRMGQGATQLDLVDLNLGFRHPILVQ